MTEKVLLPLRVWSIEHGIGLTYWSGCARVIRRLRPPPRESLSGLAYHQLTNAQRQLAEKVWLPGMDSNFG